MGRLSAGHAKALLPLADGKAQVELAERIIREELAVRKVESLVARTAEPGSPAPPAAEDRDPNLVAAEEALQTALGTKVRVRQAKTGGGRLELYFFSHEEFERVYQLLLKSSRTV